MSGSGKPKAADSLRRVIVACVAAAAPGIKAAVSEDDIAGQFAHIRNRGAVVYAVELRAVRGPVDGLAELGELSHSLVPATWGSLGAAEKHGVAVADSGRDDNAATSLVRPWPYQHRWQTRQFSKAGGG